MSRARPTAEDLDPALLVELERAAVDAAALAGRHIARAFAERQPVEVTWKRPATARRPPGHPVTAVDREAEAMVRDLLESRFPDHGMVGEELTDRDRGGELLWLIDPIDGTSNFIHRHPLVAASVGVVHAGVPLAGAVWCGATHALGAGVYHARRGAAACFEGEPLAADPRALPKRLASAPPGTARHPVHDLRGIGSAATECAWVAAGILAAARLNRLHPWDVAAGLLLVQAAGGRVLTQDDGGWTAFESFLDGDADAVQAVHAWHRPLILTGPDVERDDVPGE